MKVNGHLNLDWFRTCVNADGTSVGKRDELLLAVVLSLQESLLYDLTDLHPSYTLNLDGYDAFIRNIRKKGLNVTTLSETLEYTSYVIKTYSHSVSRSECSRMSWTVFKQQIAERNLYYGFLQPIAQVLDAFFANETDSEAFAIVYQWVEFPRKVTLTTLKSLSSKAVQSYIDTESSLSRDLPTKLVSDLRKILLEVVPRHLEGKHSSEVPTWFHPSHGNGATAEVQKGSPLVNKYIALGRTPKIEYLCRQYPFLDSFIPKRELPIGVAKVVCVPKSMTKKRTISMEPTVNQYLQHAIERYFNDNIFRGRLSRHINLRDQSKSRDAALKGSYTKKLDTIDLSSASDRVTNPLVQELFKGTDIFTWMQCTRCEYATVPDYGTISLTKFAPMGSDCCFVTQSLVYALVCEYAARMNGFQPWTCNYTVYGDDIITDANITSMVISYLTILGFIVNSDKTHRGEFTHFRESCGCDAYNGMDVTPLRISRKFTVPRNTRKFSKAKETEAPCSWIDLINRAYSMHFYQLRLKTLNIFGSFFPDWKKLHFVESAGFVSDTISNDSIRTFPHGCTNYVALSRIEQQTKMQTDLQIETITVLGVRSYTSGGKWHWKKSKEDFIQEAMYQMWIDQDLNRSDDSYYDGLPWGKPGICWCHIERVR